MNHNNFSSILLNIINTEQLPNCKQPINVAIPFKKGTVDTLSNWSLHVPDHEVSTYSLRDTSLWSDGSVKWALLRAVIPSPNLGWQDWQLQSAPPLETANQSIRIVENVEGINVYDGNLCYQFSCDHDQVFPNILKEDMEIWSGTEFFIKSFNIKGEPLEFERSNIDIEDRSEVSVKIVVRGSMTMESSRSLQLSFQFEILSGGWLKLDVYIHNAHRAKHENGFWDLGDRGSISFNEFSIVIPVARNDLVQFRTEPRHDWRTVGLRSTKIYQDSSGGDNWNSPNHIDSNGISCNSFRGYRVENNQEEVSGGDRAEPLVWVNAGESSSWGFKLSQYWQNFPKCLEFNDTSLVLGLFPSENKNGYELQGGERKQHQIVFSFSPDLRSLDWVDETVTLSVPQKEIEKAQVFTYVGSNCRLYDRLISKSLDAEEGFFAKREVIDEYGWRNFGDIFADHETLYDSSSEYFISHYNNQYDPIYGFGRQYLLTGEVKWFFLMRDLVRHVLDIDIYRTKEDRVEYNHGLFWHTDHYKKAHTCTHRTYSVEHIVEGSDSEGGGPGNEHCYSSGLLLYFQITGDTQARDAVLGLTDWIRNFYEGTGSVLEVLKNFATIERSKFTSLCKGKPVFKHRYPLDRGTGNYVRALLDSYEVTGKKEYVTEAENIINSTFAFSDELEARQFHDVESTWFYTIFLQEVVRYLDLKRDLKELDSSFKSARFSLLHYTKWMVNHEIPYLEIPDRLEFPNDTWVAQDIRKANIMYAAYKYATTERFEYLEKARYFRDYVVDKLLVSDTLHFSRIQIILLQNHGPSNCMDVESDPYAGLSDLTTQKADQVSCFHTIISLLLENGKKLFLSLKEFSLRREINWLKARIG